MDVKEFRNMLKAIDSMVAMKEYDLAQEMTLKALQELRVAPGLKSEEGEDVKAEIEKELVAKYLSARKLGDQKAGLLRMFLTTAVKASAVLLVFLLLNAIILAIAVPYINKRYNRIMAEFEDPNRIKRTHIEAMISANPYLYYRLASIFEQSGEVEKAIYQIEKARGLQPENEDYVEMLARLHFKRSDEMLEEGRFEEAIERVELAKELRPDNELYVEALGDVYYRIGTILGKQDQYEEAIEYVEKAIATGSSVRKYKEKLYDLRREWRKYEREQESELNKKLERESEAGKDREAAKKDKKEDRTLKEVAPGSDKEER